MRLLTSPPRLRRRLVVLLAAVVAAFAAAIVAGRTRGPGDLSIALALLLALISGVQGLGTD
jgi:hypothetical protein